MHELIVAVIELVNFHLDWGHPSRTYTFLVIVCPLQILAICYVLNFSITYNRTRTKLTHITSS